MDGAESAAGSSIGASENEAVDGTARPKRDRRGQDRPRLRGPHPRRYDRHGLTTLKRTVATLGGRVLDGRFAVARELRAWRAGLVRDLGGDLSTQELALVDEATTTKLLLGSINSWLLVQPSHVNARRKAVLQAVKDRQALVDSLTRTMQALGLKRRAVDGGDAARALLEVKALREATAAAVSTPAGDGSGS